ncbi:hypothetical protein Dda_3137 [Drechslerella dactyloides]|uniref:FAD dependent oxidoreductase domain-containing protein n=1 Tax=Drechslerella dactyloides TaxID=74499 RepID=A0AAD6NLH6_DREDA|nr:hypothetical protein Dda_3137 [Drechslerella dactyloides]
MAGAGAGTGEGGDVRSVIVVGAGVFGLTTALSLSYRPAFKNCTITVVDRRPFPAADGASIDSSRIIRADYSDPVYAALAADALAIWRLPERHPDDSTAGHTSRGDDDGGGNGRSGGSGSVYEGVGAGGRYNESGLVLVSDGSVSYVSQSYENVKSQFEEGDVEMLADKEGIRAAMGTGGAVGCSGYINRRSGWADARAAMMWVRERCIGRNIHFLHDTVRSLSIRNDTNTVTGVVMNGGEVVDADLTILAAGAWTPSLVPLGGRAVCTAQVMAYVPVTAAEEAALVGMPVTLNLSTGLFVFPPRGGELKIARHAYGYVNHTHDTDASGEVEGESKVGKVSRVVTGVGIPERDEGVLSAGLAEMVPELAGRKFSKTRLCWYTDTPTGDFIVGYHPTLSNLFLATGGSGHAFKFLPVLGEKIADGVMGYLEPSLAERWAVRGCVDGMVVTRDGSRAGEVGVELGSVMPLDYN